MGKRLFDIVFAALALLLLCPLLLAVALWVRLDSPGPALFRQQRVGRGGRPFHIYKFRTMRADAEAAGPQITVGADARITRAGAAAPRQGGRAAAVPQRAARRHERGRAAPRGAALRGAVSVRRARDGPGRAPRHHRRPPSPSGTKAACSRAARTRSAPTSSRSCPPSCCMPSGTCAPAACGWTCASSPGPSWPCWAGPAAPAFAKTLKLQVCPSGPTRRHHV